MGTSSVEALRFSARWLLDLKTQIKVLYLGGNYFTKRLYGEVLKCRLNLGHMIAKYIHTWSKSKL